MRYWIVTFMSVYSTLFGITVIGHRGNSSEAPENTLVAFEKAIEAGVDFIEFDVHLTKDGVPIVIHDQILGRTTTSGHPLAINTLTLDEVKLYDAGAWFDAKFTGEKLPTLEEVLDKAQDRVGLMIEIKSGSAPEEKLALEVLKVIEKAKLKGKTGPIIVGSFSIPILETIRKKAPEQPIIAIVEHHDQIEKHKINKPEYYALKHTLATPQNISSLQKEGRKVWVWVVDSEPHMNQMLHVNVEGFISNAPKKLLSSPAYKK